MTKSRGINRSKHKWTSEQLEYLVRSYPDRCAEDIAADIGCSVPAVYTKAHGLGLKKSAAFLASAQSGRLGKLSAAGERYRFPKGHVPANKGTKRPGWSPGRMAETQFKAGSAPHNTLPVGSLRLEPGTGTLQQKISEAKGSNSVRWRGVHELVWVRENGPVPPKHIVVFKPGMRTTVLEEITIDKVECISLAENMRRNTRHNYPKEINEVIQARAVLTRHINKRRKNDEQRESEIDQ